jgi:hypothetical protein
VAGPEACGFIFLSPRILDRPGKSDRARCQPTKSLDTCPGVKRSRPGHTIFGSSKAPVRAPSLANNGRIHSGCASPNDSESAKRKTYRQEAGHKVGVGDALGEARPRRPDDTTGGTEVAYQQSFHRSAFNV